MRKYTRLTALLISAIFSVFAAISCSNGRKTGNTEFPEFVKACTGGMVPVSSPVRIDFSISMKGAGEGIAAEEGLFSFSPAVKGHAEWVSRNRIEFYPERLQPGTEYKVKFRLDKVSGMTDGGPREFTFTFRTMPKEARMDIEGIYVSDDAPDKASIAGKVSCSEKSDVETVRKMLSCSETGKDMAFSIVNAEKEGEFDFSISGIRKAARERKVTVTLDGRKGGFDSHMKEEVTIPAKDDFSILQARMTYGETPHIDIFFSSPLDPDTDSEGLVETEGTGRTYTEFKDNRITVFCEGIQDDGVRLFISGRTRGSCGKRLGEDFIKEFKEETPAPAVEIPVQGTILPDTKHLELPFRAVNLSAVDISVIKIYEDNVLMFLQDNNLDEDSFLRRSGRMIYKKTIRLDTDPGKDLHKWQDFSIDLSGLLLQEPGAIYRIMLSFRQEYYLYGNGINGDSASRYMVAAGDGTDAGKDGETWDIPNPYYHDDLADWRSYKWSERDNPSKPSYYMVASRMPKCNLMTSSVGIIAKEGDTGRIWVTANDIMTGKPLEKAEITIYNYQLRPIGKAVTGKGGFAEVEPDGKAFIIAASSGKSVSYLKVRDGLEKSLSRFDVGGKTVSNGLKGFAYAERGVWRPGDTLHVALIVEDMDGDLPDNHPVTLEVYNPAGQFHDRQMSTSGKDGFHVFDILTSEEDPTGLWNAYFKVGGSTFHKSLRVETVKPNRLRMQVGFDGKTLSAGRKTPVRFEASWLTGPPAASLKSSVDMTLRAKKSVFKGYEKYCFDNPASEFSSMTMELFSRTLDENGKAYGTVDVPAAENAPGMLEANLVCKVTEPGGDVSMTSMSMPFSPYPAYTGIMIPEGKDGFLETDKDHSFSVVTVDESGKALSGRKLEYSIYKLDWTWWWESRSGSLDSYVNGTMTKPCSSGTLISSGKPDTISFRVNYPDWGRFLVYVKDVNGGHATGSIIYIDWPLWKGRADRKNPDALTMLTFSTDKKEYSPGEEATVFIPAADRGMALVSLENASKVISREWVKTSADKETPYRIRITGDMAPNFYVHITLLQPHSSTANDLPVRMYGVQPVFVTDKATVLHPEIKVKDVIRPMEEFSVRISEKDGKPMTYTLAIVDEGLLDLTSFKTPDPWNEMYAREALGVRTWDLYDDVIGAYSGRFSPMFSTGGDQDIIKPEKRDKRFNPVVKFLGPFTLEKGKSLKHDITLPMYVGSVRIMVVAGKDKAYGNAWKSVPVRSPLMVLPTLPRKLGTNETTILPVNVFAMEDNVKDVKVRVTAEGPVQLVSDSEDTVIFASAGDRLVNFALKTSETPGKARITVSAEGGGNKVAETISIDVDNPNPATVRTLQAIVAPGKSEKFSFEPFNTSEDNWARITLSGFPVIDFNRCFGFISSYPYNCTEQLSANGITLLSIRQFLSDSNKAEADRMIPKMLNDIYSRQLPDGGFTYWPGSSHPDEWVSSMAGQFMTMAAKNGFSVDNGVYASWKSFQEKCVRNYRHSGLYDLNDLVQAYRLYTLAAASSPSSGAMNRLKESPGLSNQARWRLAAAYALTGKKKIAEEMVNGMAVLPEDYSSSNVTYGASARDLAANLETMVLTGDMASATRAAREFTRTFSREGFMSTQVMAFAAYSMSLLADKINTGHMEAEISGCADGSIKSAKAVSVREIDGSSGECSVTNNSGGPVYASLSIRSRIPSGRKIEAAASGLALSVSYCGKDGDAINPEFIRQGTEFSARIIVSNTNGSMDYSNLALTFPIPSGWEIFNPGLFSGEDSAFDNRDIRDDRVLFYFGLPAGARKEFNVSLMATYQGKFTLPPVVCESMYEPGISANTASGKAEVTR